MAAVLQKKVNNDKSIPKIIEFIRQLYTFSIGFFVCSSKKLFFNQIDTHSNVLYDFKMKRGEKKTRNTITWNAESVKMPKDFTKTRECPGIADLCSEFFAQHWIQHLWAKNDWDLDGHGKMSCTIHLRMYFIYIYIDGGNNADVFPGWNTLKKRHRKKSIRNTMLA